METDSHGYSWFALQVRTAYEKKVATHLNGRGYEPFLPLRPSRRRWSDRIKETKVPLFPGYLFCRINIAKRLPILTTPGVVRIVGNGRGPQPVDEVEVAAIQTLIRSELTSQPWPFLKIGERVTIERGPLRGVEGILLEFKGGHRLVLSVTLLQRSVAVEIDGAYVSAPITGYPRAISSRAFASLPNLRP